MRFVKMLLSPFVSAAPAIAGPLEDGGIEYKKGDYATALRLLLPLANEGEPSAQYNIGLMYDKGQSVVQDCSAAMSWYRKAADQGHVLAQFALGAMYFDGTRGAPQDYGQALEWYLKAAKQGYALAQANLGMMFGNGLGVPRYHDVALMWLIVAAETADKENRDQVVKLRDTAAKKMTPVQIAEAQRLAREWWKATNVNAASRPAVARPFEDGLAAAEKGDYATALRLWRPLADQGEPNAQYNIGLMYDQGKGVPQDHVQAAAWYRKAGEQGHRVAQHNIGVMYANGQGVPQDSATAVAWYRKAGEQGLSSASTTSAACITKVKACRRTTCKRRRGIEKLPTKAMPMLSTTSVSYTPKVKACQRTPRLQRCGFDGLRSRAMPPRSMPSASCAIAA
jgi:TPR repeat protein